MNLKAFYDALIAANAALLATAEKIQTAINLGTDEGLQEALALRPALDECEAKAKAAQELYDSMVRASTTTEAGAAAKFVPVNDDAAKSSESRKELKRTEFEKLSAGDKMSFMLGDGRIVE